MATTSEPDIETLNSEKTPYWSWKDDDFIAQGKFSWLALGEIFAAMVFYYWVASISSWPWVIVLSFMIAPLLLLRSERSILRGQDLLLIYHGQRKLSLQMKWIIVFTSLTCGSILFFCLAQYWRFGNGGWSFFWKSAAIGVISIVGACTSAMAISIAGAGPQATLRAIPFNIDKTRFHALSLLFMPGFVLGLCIKAWEIRLIATFTHLQAGLSALSKNWTEAVIVSDMRHMPALLPGADKVARMYVFTKLLNGQYRNNLVKIIRSITAFSYFFIALIYRWNLKASALIWGPIALGLSPTNWRNYTEMREQSSLSSEKWLFYTSVGFLVALTTLLIAIPNSLSDFIASLPKWMDSKTVIGFIPQQNTLRYGLLCLFSLSFAVQLFLAWRMRTQHDKPLSSAADFKPYFEDAKLKDDLDSFSKQANQLHRMLKINTAIAIFTVWAFALKFALDKWPNELQKIVWDWLKPLL